MNQHASSVTTALLKLAAGQVARAGGWLPFDRYMALALYAPGLGYYANTSRKFGTLPGSGSDFVTAPEMSPLFGRTLAAQLREALEQTGTDEIWEFGAGSGALARELLQSLGERVRRYTIVELSASLRERQQRAHLGFVLQFGLERFGRCMAGTVRRGLRGFDCRAAVVHRHLPAGGSEFQGDAAAEPARAAGDQHGTACLLAHWRTIGGWTRMHPV